MYNRLSSIVLSGHASGIERRVGRPRLELFDVIRKDLKKIGILGEGVKSKALNISREEECGQLCWSLGPFSMSY